MASMIGTTGQMFSSSQTGQEGCSSSAEDALDDPTTLQQLLLCPVCRNVPHTPIVLCTQGHNICLTCRKNETLKECPLCKSEFTTTRNLLAEQLVEKFYRKCMYSEQGCKMTILIKDWDSHIIQCHFREVTCDAKYRSACKGEKYPFKSYFSHLRRAHGIEGLKGTVVSLTQFVSFEQTRFQIEVPRDGWPMKYMKAFSNVFLTGTAAVENKIYWWISLIGSEEEAAKYVTKISLNLKNNRCETSWTGPVHSFRTSSESVIEQGMCLLLTPETLYPYTCIQVTQGCISSHPVQAKKEWKVTFYVSKKDECSPASQTPLPIVVNLNSAESLGERLTRLEQLSSLPASDGERAEVSIISKNVNKRALPDLSDIRESKVFKMDIVGCMKSILNKLTCDNFKAQMDQLLKLPFETSDEWMGPVIKSLFKRGLETSLYIQFACNLCAELECLNEPIGEAYKKALRCEYEELVTSNQSKELKQPFSKQERLFLYISCTGELYKAKLFRDAKYIVNFAQRLLVNEETDLQCLCQLLTIVGETLEKELRQIEEAVEKFKSRPDGASSKKLPEFIPKKNWIADTMTQLKKHIGNTEFSASVRLALLNVVELRENDWKPRINNTSALKGGVHKIKENKESNSRKKNQVIEITSEKSQQVEKREESPQNTRSNESQTKQDHQTSAVKVTAERERDRVTEEISKKPAQKEKADQRVKSKMPGESHAKKQDEKVSKVTNTAVGEGDRVTKETANKESAQSKKAAQQVEKSKISGESQAKKLDDKVSKVTDTAVSKDIPSERIGVIKTAAVTSRSRPLVLKTDCAPSFDLEETVKNLFQEYLNSGQVRFVPSRITQTFPGERMADFVKELSQQAVQMSEFPELKKAGLLIRAVFRLKIISKDMIFASLFEGVCAQLAKTDGGVSAQLVVLYFAQFCVEIFSDEPNLDWLNAIGRRFFEINYFDIFRDLCFKILNFLKLKLNEKIVQRKLSRTIATNFIIIMDIPWLWLYG